MFGNYHSPLISCNNVVLEMAPFVDYEVIIQQQTVRYTSTLAVVDPMKTHILYETQEFLKTL